MQGARWTAPPRPLALLVVVVLMLAALLGCDACGGQPCLGEVIKGILKKITLPPAQLATNATVHVGNSLGRFDGKTVDHLKRTCDKSGCKRKACALARTNWCKDFFAQAPTPWKPAPRGNKECPKTKWGACNNVGNCNYDFGICECPAGWGGDDCAERVSRPCTNRMHHPFEKPQNPIIPYSHMNASHMDIDPGAPGSSASRCVGYCDDDISSCWCPPGTKYGHIPAPAGSPPGTPPVRWGRPMNDHCRPGTLWDGRVVKYGSTFMKWEHVFGPNGWCNADSFETLAKEAEPCRGCQLEGHAGGEFCAIANDQFCHNQCSGHGTCNMGFCKCDEGWFGVECSRKRGGLLTGPGQEPGTPIIPQGKEHTKLSVTTIPAALERPPAPTRLRPLIYVYDMPPEFTTRMLQYRIIRGKCVWRYMDIFNNTIIPAQNYGTETYLHEMLLQSPHRTLDPEEADFFYVPTYMGCYYWPILGWADHPWFGEVGAFQRPYQGAHMLLKAKRWLEKALPYWNRRQGRDHIWFMAVDEGACYMPTEIYNTSIVLTHWGRLDLNHTSGTAWGADNYTRPLSTDAFPVARKGEDWRDMYRGHPCYNPEKDLVLPQFKAPNQFPYSPLLGTAPLVRDVLFMFRGDVGYWRDPWYSRGVRQKLVMLAHKNNWAAQGVVIGDRDTVPYDYSQLLARSVFCAAITGDGWATRIEDAIQHGCIPVIFHDAVHGPFESIFEYDSFTIRLRESSVDEDLPKVLAAISPEQIERMQRRIAAIMPRFTFAHGALVQAHAAQQARQQQPKLALVKQQEPPGHPMEVHKRLPTRIDAFSTIIQWLHSRIEATR